MKKIQPFIPFRPTNFKYAQASVSKQAEGSEAKTNVIPVHITPDGYTAHITSCWVGGILARLKVLFTGKIWVVIHYESMVPLSVLGSSPLRPKNVEKEVLETTHLK